MNKHTHIPVYTYLDYRAYLRDYVIVAKERDKAFSLRNLARMCGVKTPNFISWLIDGKRNLAPDTACRLCDALGLDEQSGHYFKILVTFNQEKSTAQKHTLFTALEQLRKPIIQEHLASAQFELYKEWYVVAIRELLNYYAFNPSELYAYRKLARKLQPAISETQARKAIRLLKKLGLVIENQDGILELTAKNITTGDEVNSFFVRTFHKTMIERGGAALDTIEQSQRDISGLTMSISQPTFDIVKKEIALFRKHLVEIIKNDPNPDRVCHLTMQFFPLTNFDDSESSE